MGTLSCSVDLSKHKSVTSNIPAGIPAESATVGNAGLACRHTVLKIYMSIPSNNCVRVSTLKASSFSCQSALSRRHSGGEVPLSPLPKTPPLFSPGSTTRKTLAHLSAP